ncbi:MAG: hypothetical protein ACTSR7_20255 [Promethearchaeota archaeon]
MTDLKRMDIAIFIVVALVFLSLSMLRITLINVKNMSNLKKKRQILPKNFHERNQCRE